MQIVSNGLTKKVLTGTVISLFALFVVMLPRYTDTAKTWYFFLILIARAHGPVSLVSALTSLQPLVVLVLSVLVSFWYPQYIYEELGRTTVAWKAAAIAVLITGAFLVS